MEHLLVYPAFVAFLIVFIAGLCFQGRPLRGQALDRIEKVAKSFKGTFDPGHYFRKPRLRFEVDGIPVELTWTGRNTQNSTDSRFLRIIAEVRLGDAAPGNLKIWRRDIPWRPRVGLPWFCPRVVFGVPEVDQRLGVRSKPRALAEALLAPERRARAMELAYGLAGDDALSVSGGILRASWTADEISPGAISGLSTLLRDFVRLLRDLPGTPSSP